MASPLVVLTDFYAVTNRALSYAAGLAVPLNAELVLLHVRHGELLAPSIHSPYLPISEHTTTRPCIRWPPGSPYPPRSRCRSGSCPRPCAPPCATTTPSCWCWAGPAKPIRPWKS